MVGEFSGGVLKASAAEFANQIQLHRSYRAHRGNDVIEAMDWHNTYLRKELIWSWNDPKISRKRQVTGILFCDSMGVFVFGFAAYGIISFNLAKVVESTVPCTWRSLPAKT